MLSSHKTALRVADALHATSPGRIQSVGYMQVIPLISDLSDDRFVSPVESKAEVFTNDYGILGFCNATDSVMIVPCHAAYVVKEAAQDHAMAHVGLVDGKADRSFVTAMCIEENQVGYIPSAQYRMMILPHALREPALQKRERREYGKLWEDIDTFNRDLGITAPSHLEYFFRQFQKELDQFVAEFECVPNQLGAIVLIDGQVVGIERVPSWQYWHSVWPCLIRECYGSLAIQVARRKGTAAEVPASRRPLPDGMATLDALATAIAEIARQEDDDARAVVRELLDEPLELTTDETQFGLTLETLVPGRFAGQIVRHGQRIVYASMPVAKEWLANRQWQVAKPFAI